MQTFLPDTNAFRYLNGEESLKRAASAFFTGLEPKVQDGTAKVLLSAEVACELKVQTHPLTARDATSIDTALSGLRQIDSNFSKALEHKLRNFSNYIRSARFGGAFMVASYSLNHLKASDARIMVDAYLSDATLVTYNIKGMLQQ